MRQVQSGVLEKEQTTPQRIQKEMGQRELAYEINKYKMGYYFLFVIESENNDATVEFDRVALINENIIRHLIVKVEE